MIRWACCGLILLVVPAASAAPPTDVATLFPSETVAFAEVHGPAELGPQLAALFKGTPLENSIPFIHSKKDQARTIQDLRAKKQLAELALFVSPEVLAEFRKLGGIAVGFLGFNSRGEPEAALAVLTGQSAAAGLAARMFVTTTPSLRKVAEVSKVPVFQHRQPRIQYDASGQPKLENDKPLEEGLHERTYAFTPGLFVVGTSKAAIAPLIKRFLNEEKGSLGSRPSFKAAAVAYRKPGLFFYADVPAILTQFDAASRARSEPLDSDMLAWLRIVVSQKAMKTVAGLAQFRDGGMALAIGAQFDPAQKSPLAHLLSGPVVTSESLAYAKKPAIVAASFNLPEKDRAAAIVGFLDATAKAGGVLGRLPGDVLKELEENRKVPVRALLTKVRTVTVVVPAKRELPKDARPMPMLVLQLDDNASATAWEEMLPKLVAEIAHEKQPAPPSSETVGGVKTFSLPATGLPWKTAVHFARKDATLVIGQNRNHVAGALIPAAASVTGSKPLPLPEGELKLVGTLGLGQLIGAIEFAPGTGSGPPLNSILPVSRGRLIPSDERVKAADTAQAALAAAFEKLPPVVLTVRRSGDELKLELFQPKVQNGGLTPVIGAAANWFDKLIEMNPRNANPYYPNAGYEE